MKKKISLWMLTAVLFTGGIMALSSCSHDKDDYVKKPYDVNRKYEKQKHGSE